MPKSTSLPELQEYFKHINQYGTTHAVHQQLLDDIWGEAPPYAETTEDKASIFSTYLYTWVYPYALQASKESLTPEKLPPATAVLQSQYCGRKLSKALQRALYDQNAWGAVIGSEVKSRLDDDSRGTLRWVGVPQQGKYSRMMAGIEWSVAPKLRETERNGATNPFFDGVAYGEHMFTPDKPGMSTLEDPFDLMLTIPTNAVLPHPPIPKRIPLFWTILSTLPSFVCRQIPFVFCSMGASLAGPLILKSYIEYLTQEEYNGLHGVLIVGVLGVTYVLQPILRHRGFYLSICAGVQFRSALSSLIFEKCMTMSIKSLSLPAMNPGRIVNMLSTDVERTVSFFSNLDTIWSSPLQLVISIFMLYNMVGWCSFVGLLIFLATLPMNTYIMSVQMKSRRALSALTDARIRGTNEFISGIRVTKFMAWEPRFVHEIEKKRNAELQQLRRIQYCRVIMSFLSNATPTLMLAVVFTLYYVIGKELTPTVVFPTIALFGLIRGPFLEIPFIITSVIQFQVSLERLRKFFECENTPYTTVEDIEQLIGERGSRGENSEDDPAIVMENADLTAYIPVPLPKAPSVSTPLWRRILRVFLRCHDLRPPRTRPPLTGDYPASATENSSKRGKKRSSKKKKKSKLEGEDDCFELEEKVLLHDVSVEVPRGKLTLVIGPTGSGKSTLMQSLLSQLEVTKGRVWATKSIAYVPQQPWIMNATMRENILFFSEEREEDLKEALRVGQLETDLGLIAGGLETEIGEKGINLSGGQKARVSLARAVYADREMYLLDDPLSALDAHVGERVVNECILGKLAGKTRVLATHQLHVLKHADHVIALGEKRVLFSGDRDSFLKSDVYRVMQPNGGASDEDSDSEGEEESLDMEAIERHASSQVVESTEDKANSEQITSGLLMTEEEKAVGSVPMSVYMKYFDYCGGLRKMVMIVVLFAVTEVLSLSATLWLSLWSTDAFGLPVTTYLKWYLIMVLVGTTCSPLRNLSGYSVMRRGSVLMHQAVLRSMSAATMEFFDTTPVGRIVHRFSRDIDVIDNTLQMALIAVVEYTMAIISSTTISIVTIPIFAVTLVPCAFFYYRIMGFYGNASREARRFLSLMKSPVYSLLGEMTNGSSTIEAYSASAKFMAEATRRLDLVTSCYTFSVLIHRWLGIRVELCNAVLITTIAAFGALTSKHNGTDTALISLSLTMAMQTSSTILRLLRQSVTVETEMNSIERLVHYIDNIPHEDMPELSAEVDAMSASHTGKVSAVVTDAAAVGRSGSPVITAGSMEFRRVQMRYRDGLPLVLRDVSFRIAPREKVGVVGRTGSGKSTLMLTFMRMVDICGGEILVNGSGIRTYPLRELRKQFSMIPQDPVLFDGTVRQNLDPFLESSVDEVWEALTLCGLRERVESEVGGLDARVLEGGSNFSVGQRQLLCLARALLRKGSGFILMDEATANIDPALDRYIQGTVMNAFAEYTVITIAHRLHTVANYDKIIVMDQGIVAEIGTPRELVSNRQSVFRGMVESMGEAGMDEFMHLLQ